MLTLGQPRYRQSPVEQLTLQNCLCRRVCGRSLGVPGCRRVTEQDTGREEQGWRLGVLFRGCRDRAVRGVPARGRRDAAAGWHGPTQEAFTLPDSNGSY